MHLRRRQREAVVVHVPAGTVTGDVVEVPKTRRRSAAEVANDAIVAEQLANQEREKVLEQKRRELAAEWAASRPRGPVSMDYSRFTY